MNAKTLDTNLLAMKFSEALRDMVDDNIVEEINRLNSTEEYEGVCASHNFCDPNQAMVNALELLGFEYLPGLNETINQAWEMAKAFGFSAPSNARKIVKLATIKRECLALYESDLTYVVLSEGCDPLYAPVESVKSIS